jgi:GntR family transcriptional regulator
VREGTTLFIVLSTANPDPMYKQVADQIKDAIAAGTLSSNARLPSIRELSQELALSPITIRRAYGDLESEGYIIMRPGLGSFVAGIDRDTLREEKVREIRREIARIVKTAGIFGIPLGVIRRIINEMKEEKRSR